MIKMRNVTSGAASSKYYDKDGYYTPGSDEAREASEWFGRGAADAGLVGEVDGDKFTELLNGTAPDGQIMGVMRGGERQHRPGLDLTMNAPKEVSILALVFEDKRVLAAHDQVVREVAAYVEDKLMMTRVGRNGSIEVEPASNVIAGLFRHDTSRELDPHLHTHAVFANMVKTDLGDKYRSIHNDVIEQNALLLTQLYHARMAELVKGLGFEASLNRDGFLEVAGLEDLKDPFSKRHLEILQALDERGREATGANRQLAALMTRQAKKITDRSELTPLWDKQAEFEGWNKERRDAFIEAAKARAAEHAKETERGSQRGADDGSSPQSGGNPTGTNDREGAKSKSVREAVDFAIRHISEREAVYHEADLKLVALRRMDKPDLRAIDTEIARLVVQEKRLFSIQTDKGRYFSDSETMAAEREVIKHYRASVREKGVEIGKSLKHRLTSTRTPEAALDRRLNRTTLTDGQKDAIKLSLLGEGRFVGVQGYAGTGKTFMLSKLKDYAERYGYTVEGVAPTNKARAKLQEVIPGANTITSFIQSHAQGKSPMGVKNRILVVDEAAMVSTKDFRDLMRAANEQGISRVVFQGDIKQLEAVGAGVPYKQLQQVGMVVALMDDIRRQDNEQARDAVLHAMRGEVRQAFEKVGEVVAHENVTEHTAESWLALSKKDRATTGILVLTNKRRREVNDLVRAGLKQDGTLKGPSIVLPTIDPLDQTRASTGDAQSYRKGDTILSVGQLKSYGIQPYDLLKVVDRDVEANTIQLSFEDRNETVKVKLGQNSQAAAKLVAFKNAPREFNVGDRVKFNLGDRDTGILKGEFGTIAKFEKKSAIVHLDAGDKARIDLTSFVGRGLDHAYALTAHAFQGDDTKDVIVGMGSRERLATQKALYVEVSRVTNAAKIITDDVEKLISRISKNTGESMDALTEVTRQKISDLFTAAGLNPTPEAGKDALVEGLEQEAATAPDKPEKPTADKDGKDGLKEEQTDPSKETKSSPDEYRKTAEETLAKEAQKDPRTDRENDGEKWDGEAVRKDLEARWEKYAEDRSRGRGERSR